MRAFWMGLLLVSLTGCTEYSLVTHKKDTILYPPEREVEVGLRVAQRFLEVYPPVEDSQIQDRVEKIGENLVRVCQRKDIPYQFVVVDFPGKNAISLPGGYVFISKELVQFCHSDDEIASVLAHEIGHIVAKHGIKRLQASYLALLGVLAGAASRDRDLARGIAGALRALFSAYSQEDEFTADRLGASYMRKAGYDVRAMIALFSRLEEESRYFSPKRPVSYFRTHPFLSQRINRIKAMFLGSEEAEFLDFVNRR